ncbi:MAG: hypothetical protein QME42_02585 [bacterium]|nr:hypothetical protein [bacterium]
MKSIEGILKQVIRCLGIVSIVVLLSSCASKPENEIVGKWEEIGGTESIEFFKDGTVSGVDKGRSMVGSYKFVDKDRIKMEMGGFGALTGPVIMKVSFSGGELTFTTQDSKVLKYSKENLHSRFDPDSAMLTLQ